MLLPFSVGALLAHAPYPASQLIFCRIVSSQQVSSLLLPGYLPPHDQGSAFVLAAFLEVHLSSPLWQPDPSVHDRFLPTWSCLQSWWEHIPITFPTTWIRGKLQVPVETLQTGLSLEALSKVQRPVGLCWWSEASCAPLLRSCVKSPAPLPALCCWDSNITFSCYPWYYSFVSFHSFQVWTAFELCHSSDTVDSVSKFLLL